jgi:hypothetical protein
MVVPSRIKNQEFISQKIPYIYNNWHGLIQCVTWLGAGDHLLQIYQSFSKPDGNQQ